MSFRFEVLLGRMQELRDLGGLIGLASWDQQTYLPKKADAARGSQLSTLQGLYHERLVHPTLGELLAEAKASSSLDADQRAMVRVLTVERDRAVKVPSRLVTELAEAQSHGFSAWLKAREEKRFDAFQPHLERLFALRREQADAMGHGGERYDAMLEAYEPGMRVERLTPVLESLRQQLVPMVAAIDERPKPRDIFGGKQFDENAQWQFTIELLRSLQFDLDSGRQDRSVHPFTGGTHPRDVRLTTRVKRDSLLTAVFGTIHECGHGLYEQGFSEAHFRTPLAQAPSMGMHESQSRLWENPVGRSHGFWKHFFPRLQAGFRNELGGVSLDEFVAAVNRVERDFIRVEADEVTYNLHIVLRYELELALTRDDLQVKDLPGAWNEKMQSLLGLAPPDPVLGVLQDVHWSGGDFGYFPTYSLGNLYSASLFAAAHRELPELDQQIERGEFLPLREWLRKRVHAEGFRYSAEELVKKVTGKGLTDVDFVAYLKTKYSALYDVKL